MGLDPESLLDLETRIRELREEAGEQGSEEEGTVPPAPAENSTIKAIRAEAKRAEKARAAAEAERDELRKFKEETVAAQRNAVFAAEGLTARQAEAALAMGVEATPESVRVFKSEVLGVSADAEGDGESVPAQTFAPAGFAPEKPEGLAVEGSQAVRDFVSKHGVDAAEKAWREGKLKL